MTLVNSVTAESSEMEALIKILSVNWKKKSFILIVLKNADLSDFFSYDVKQTGVLTGNFESIHFETPIQHGSSILLPLKDIFVFKFTFTCQAKHFLIYYIRSPSMCDNQIGNK